MKWVALALIVLGVVSLITAYRMSATSSFDDGTFILQILLMIAGGLMLVAGVITFGVLLFMNL